jgi:alpha-mannosidase
VHDDRELGEARIRRAVRERIRPAIHGERLSLDVTAWHVPGEPVPVAAAREAEYVPFEIGGRWGKPWGTTWFRLQGRVPEDWAGRTAELRVDFGTGVGAGFQSEGLLYRTAGGGPLRGIHPFHQAVPLDLVADEDGSIDVLVEAAANPTVAMSHEPTPLGDLATAGDALLYRLNAAELAVRNDDVWHLDLDLQIVIGTMRELSTDDPRRFELLRAVLAAVDEIDIGDVAATAAPARAALEPVLARPATEHAHRMSAIGHAHIDTAWLWPLRETRRKCARTFSSAVTLMDAYPEYRFACSQAAQYDWVEHDHPELFERIRAKVAEGRFVPVGSMWVEADANLPSGESLARQLVWGKRYFADRFGIDTTEVWIPDVFGYAGNLPQLMAQAGCRHFLTQKLSWNQTNAFPHHTFRWEGIDGTRIFTHFPPADTYNGEVVPKELAYAVRNFRDKGRASRSMYLFGHGDGGGGPTREMIERARRVHGVDGHGLDGLPRLTIESPAEFFDAAEAEYPDAPIWRGELYFEMHRGTYTSQAKTKWGNRRGELALRELEVWTATADDPPLADLERLWKVLLLHQFHDIIPGSSIAWVHDDTEAAHADLLAECDDLVGRSLGIAPGRRSRSTAIFPEGEEGEGDVVAANAGPFDLAAVVSSADGPVWVDAPAHGIGPTRADLPGVVEPVQVIEADAGTVLDNGIVRAAIASDGTLTSLVDRRADRECLLGPANVLQLFPDHPNTYDAWDVEAHTLALDPELLLTVDSVDVTDDGPMLAAVEVRRSFGDSSITQRYELRAGSARLDLVTEVDWNEDEKLLKAAFPLDVRAADARYDIQYGHVRRPTHRNTSWDAARFEVCAHFWADVAEPDFGVAILNDSKYGHDCLESTMRITLLRATNYPDPAADRGHHRFTYSVLPHDGTLADVLAESWALNLPPRLIIGEPQPSLVAVDHPGVVVTAVKAADDGSGDLVVRMHEGFGGRARGRLRIGVPVGEALRCDLLERAQGSAEALTDGALAFELRPFEVRTLRFNRF